MVFIKIKDIYNVIYIIIVQSGVYETRFLKAWASITQKAWECQAKWW